MLYLFKITTLLTLLLIGVSQICASAKPSPLINTENQLDNNTSGNSINTKQINSEFVKQKYWVQSLVLPGLGQIKNKKYWKLPIIYGGFGALAYSIVWNNGYYNDMINEYKARTENNTNLKPNPIYDNVPLNQFINAANYYKRNLTLSVIVAIALYGLQIIDAYVDQELAKFEVNDNLALKISPHINNFAYRNYKDTISVPYGLKLSLSLNIN
ncbi:MAG: DUF5683 domain-containing protein [Solitalea-like symbiont of Tyrophagus putrescentiae]